MTAIKVKCLFLDIGGVLLSDGWARASRKLAAKTFGLDHQEFENRHNIVFNTYELGKFTIEEYLKLVVFYEKRPFTRLQFKSFMFEQSKPYPEMIGLIRRLKFQYGLKIGVVSNEARELNAYRIQKFKLDEFVDFFISSCFVHLRKPDPGIFRVALDIAQVPANQIFYIENTAIFVQIAQRLGIRGIVHKDYKSTCTKLVALGLHDTGVHNDGR